MNERPKGPGASLLDPNVPQQIPMLFMQKKHKTLGAHIQEMLRSI